MSEHVLSGDVTVSVEASVGTAQWKVELGRVLAIASAVALVGCTPDKEPTPVVPPHDSRAAVSIQHGLATDAFADKIFDQTPDPEAARNMIPALAAGSPAITDGMNRVVDAVSAGAWLDDRRKTDGTLVSPITDLSSILDPTIRAKTITAAYVVRAGKLVRQVDDTMSIDEARNSVSLGVPDGAEDFTDHALQALDATHAEQIVKDYSLIQGEEDVARAQLSTIENPAIRELTEVAIDAHNASKLLKDLWLGRITPTEAREDASNIADAEIRAITFAAIKTGESDPYSASEISTDMYLTGSDLGYQIGDFSEPFKADERAVSSYRNQLYDDLHRSLESVEQAVGNRIATAHHLQPQEVEALKPLANPGEVVDLSTVEGLQTIPNYCSKVVSEDNKKDCGPETYQQFAELYVKDGELAVAFQDGGGLTEKVRTQIQTAIDNKRAFLEAAFASGELASVHFVIGESYNPYYLVPTREIYMVLPSDDTMSMDQLASGLSHETKHALSRNFFAGINVSDEQLRQVNNACNDLRKTAYEDFQNTLWMDPTILGDIRAAAKFEHQPIIDTLIQSVQESTFANVVSLDQHELEFALPSSVFNECYEVGASASDIVIHAIKEAGVKASYDDVKYLFETNAFAELRSRWSSLINYSSVYAQLINESNYVTTKSPDLEYLGHSEERVTEVYASLPTGALDYEDQFKSGLSKLNADERRALLDLLDLTLEELAKHPSLKNFIEAERAEYNALRG